MPAKQLSEFSLALFVEALANEAGHMTEAYLQNLADAATVCLNKFHRPGRVHFECEGELAADGSVYFSTASYEKLNSWADPRDAAEHGAIGLAALLINVLGYEVVQLAAKGTGFDYYIGPRGGPRPFLFQNTMKLEVSGIMEGNNSLKMARLSEKSTQLHSKTPGEGFAIVVEFGRPCGAVAR